MKGKVEIKSSNSVLSVFGLALLLLLSPCKVGNFIQSELGGPQTKVLNKRHSTISQSDCHTFEVSETVQHITKPSFEQPKLLVSDTDRFDFTIHLLKHSFNPESSISLETTGVPLYILYQNLKVYS